MKIPWRRKWQPTPVFFLGESHGQRNFAGYSLSIGSKEWDTSEHTVSFTGLLIPFTKVPSYDLLISYVEAGSSLNTYLGKSS